MTKSLSPDFTWTAVEMRTSRAHYNATGEIIGTVSLRDYTSPVYYETLYRDVPLGKYVDATFAKVALEEAYLRDALGYGSRV